MGIVNGEIELGRGQVFIEVVRRRDDGVVGLRFHDSGIEHEIGHRVEEGEKSYTLVTDWADSDVVVWMKNVESAEVLREVLETAIHEIEGKVELAG